MAGHFQFLRTRNWVYEPRQVSSLPNDSVGCWCWNLRIPSDGAEIDQQQANELTCYKFGVKLYKLPYFRYHLIRTDSTDRLKWPNVLHLARFAFLSNVFSLFMLAGTLCEVCVVDQTWEKGGNLRSGVHLFLQRETERWGMKDDREGLRSYRLIRYLN